MILPNFPKHNLILLYSDEGKRKMIFGKFLRCCLVTPPVVLSGHNWKVQAFQGITAIKTTNL